MCGCKEPTGLRLLEAASRAQGHGAAKRRAREQRAPHSVHEPRVRRHGAVLPITVAAQAAGVQAPVRGLQGTVPVCAHTLSVTVRVSVEEMQGTLPVCAHKLMNPDDK